MSINSNPVRSAISLSVGFTVFLAVFLLVVITTTLVTFILPETFASAARIRIDQPMPGPPGETNAALLAVNSYDPLLIQTEVEVFQSELVLRPVIVDLDLSVVWGIRFAGGEKLKTTECLELLKQRLDVRPVRGTSLLEVRVYSDAPDETAQLANAIVESYRKSLAETGRPVRVEVVDNAHPPIRPARPNKNLNITLGVAVGLVMGAGCGLFCAWGVGRVGRRPGSSHKPA